MIYLFTNCYRYLDDAQFERDLREMNFKDRDTFVFMNTCIPYKHARRFFDGRRIYTMHRQRGTTDKYFGFPNDAPNNAVKLKLSNDGVVSGPGVACEIKPEYAAGKMPTTGFFAYHFCKQFFDEPVTPVNFFGSADTSTGKWPGHDWEYEDRIMNGVSGKIYMSQPPINCKLVKDYMSFLDRFDCAKKHYIIDDAMFRSEYGYAETISRLGQALSGFEHISGIETYEKIPDDTHHWTTGFVWGAAIPKIMAGLGVDEFDPARFELVEKTEKGYSLSHHRLKGGGDFVFENAETGYSRRGPHETLRRQANKGSAYRGLYAGQHCVSRVKNLGLRSGRRLLLNCDSMSIPLVPILACYFDEILAVDNSNGRSFMREMTELRPTHYVGLGLYRNYTEHSFNRRIPENIRAVSDNKIISKNIV